MAKRKRMDVQSHMLKEGHLEEQLRNPPFLYSSIASYSFFSNNKHLPRREITALEYNQHVGVDEWIQNQNWSEDISRVYYVEYTDDSVHVVTEPLKQNIYSFFEAKLQEWQEVVGGSKRRRCASWWAYISEDFIIIFRRVFRALWVLYDQSVYHGSLKESIMIDTDDMPKLMPAGRRMETFERGIHQDLLDLKDIWETIIGLPFNRPWQYPCPLDTAAYNLPKDIINLLQNFSEGPREGVDIKFFMDAPIFWSMEERLQFVEKIYYMDNMKLIEWAQINNVTPEFQNWQNKIGKDPVLKNIYEWKNRLYDDAGNLYSTPRNLYDDSIMRYIHNTIHHYCEHFLRVVHRRMFNSYIDNERHVCKSIRICGEAYGLVRKAIMRLAKDDILHWSWVQKILLSTTVHWEGEGIRSAYPRC